MSQHTFDAVCLSSDILIQGMVTNKACCRSVFVRGRWTSRGEHFGKSTRRTLPDFTVLLTACKRLPGLGRSLGRGRIARKRNLNPQRSARRESHLAVDHVSKGGRPRETVRINGDRFNSDLLASFDSILCSAVEMGWLCCCYCGTCGYVRVDPCTISTQDG